VSSASRPTFVSRAGEKLSAALDHFGLSVAGSICADLGSHVGGFVDCLLQRGAAKVYAVDTAYGILAWKLRRDSRVVVLERTNAMHVQLPQRPDLVTIDVGWTRQRAILPVVARWVTSRQDGSHVDDEPARPSGRADTASAREDSVTLVLTLIKPHYEAPSEELVGGVLPDQAFEGVVNSILADTSRAGWQLHGTFVSPLRGHAGNREVFALLEKTRALPEETLLDLQRSGE